MNIPRHLLQLNALTDEIGYPQDAVQFAVLEADGERLPYGDQSWVAAGGAIADNHPNGRVQYRRIHITYGEWTDVPA